MWFLRFSHLFPVVSDVGVVEVGDGDQPLEVGRFGAAPRNFHNLVFLGTD